MISLALLLSTSALACPTVATGTPNGLTYDVARTAIVRQGDRTTFTVSVNPEGQSQDFALVMPVPALLQESDIAVLDGEIFARLGGYTGLLTMADAGCAQPDAGSDGGGSTGGGGGSGGDTGAVQVEAEYLVGDYQITILSATESDALFSWLEANGYHLADATVPVLEDYIEEGMYFMAARVSDAATTADGSPLPPLQVGYDADVFSIPIRLAARNSSGQQDMLIYAVTDGSGARVGISNYAEFDLDDQCIWGDPATDDFGAFYEERFGAAWEDAGQAAWTVEWAGGFGDCSPCSGVQITDEDLSALGFEGESGGHFLTRLHMRYTASTATQDLMLYGSGIREAETTSFADDNAQNRECIDACDATDDGGDGGDDGGGADDGSDGGVGGGDGTTGGDDGGSRASGEASDDGSKSGCSVAPAAPLGAVAALAGLVAVGRRRR